MSFPAVAKRHQPRTKWIRMHTIRLRRPWQKSCPGQTGASRVDVPDIPLAADMEAAAEPQCVVYRRSFNRPSGLTTATRVWLIVSGWDGALAELSLNDQPLSACGPPLRIEVTAAIAARNGLQVTLVADECGPPRLTGEVTLAIEEVGD